MTPAYNARVHTMTTSSDRWATVERVYHAALAQSVETRAAFLAEACANDEELRLQVESLLAQDASADAVLTRGAVVAAAALVTDIGRSVLTGRRLAGYQILTPLGAGGMGEVYRARDTRLGREVAIKVLPRAFTADAGRLARFEREARVLASLTIHTSRRFTDLKTGRLKASPTHRWGPALAGPSKRSTRRNRSARSATRLCWRAGQCRSGADTPPFARRYPCCARATSR